MILRARSVVTMDGPPIENGAVAVTGNRITEVSPWGVVKARAGEQVVDLGEQVLLPGLINAHCHLDYTMFRGSIPPQSSFATWIAEINRRKASLSPSDYLRSIAVGFEEAANFGTTAIANLEAFPELISQMDRPPLRTWWFAELIDVRAKISPVETCGRLRAHLQRNPDWLGGVGLAPHAPYTASAELYAECSAMAGRDDSLLTTHLAESSEEMEMFRERRGPLFDFMRAIGRPLEDCGSGTPLAWALRHGRTDGRWIVAHLNALTEDDFSLLAGAPRFHIVHCPRSHKYFGHPPFSLERLQALGFNICLGTDSLASNSTLSLLAEIRELEQNAPSLRPRQLLEMVTQNPAAALRQESQLGRIRAGFLADLIAIPVVGAGRDPIAELLAFESTMPWRMINGVSSN